LLSAFGRNGDRHPATDLFELRPVVDLWLIKHQVGASRSRSRGQPASSAVAWAENPPVTSDTASAIDVAFSERRFSALFMAAGFQRWDGGFVTIDSPTLYALGRGPRRSSKRSAGMQVRHPR
jgi:hypothetical protein